MLESTKRAAPATTKRGRPARNGLRAWENLQADGSQKANDAFDDGAENIPDNGLETIRQVTAYLG